MNQKKAKAIRKVLKNLAQLNPQGNHSEQSTTYSENKQNRKTVTVEDLHEGEMITKTIPIAAGTISVNPTCRRGLYKRLKKGMEESTHVKM